MRAEDVLFRFSSYTKSGQWYILKCPCHVDDRPSLAITTCTYKNGTTGIAVNCFAGCSASAIKEWLGTNKVCYDRAEYTKKPKKKQQKRKIVSIYPYYKDSKLLYEVVRFEPKEFSQRRYDRDGKVVWGLTSGYYYLNYGSWIKCKDALDSYEKVKYFPEVEPVLYNLTDITKGLLKNENARVFIVGGEKDVETLKKSNFLATTNSGGEGKWKPEHSDVFTNVNVVFIPDNDVTGYEHLYRVAEAVIPLCKSFKVVTLPDLKKEHEDITDWVIKYNGSAEKLKTLVEAARDYKNNPSAIRTDFVFKLPSTDSKEPVISDFILALTEEANKLSKFKDLSLLGLCPDCRGTGYKLVNSDGYFLYAAEKHDEFISPSPCVCSAPQSFQSDDDGDGLEF
jgi:hypothetical protein